MFSTLRRKQPGSYSAEIKKSGGMMSLMKELYHQVAPQAPERKSAKKAATTRDKSSESSAQTSPKSIVVGILGAKGGVGATVFATNLAAACAESKPILIDCNLQQPDVALSLGLNPRYNLCDLIERRSRLDEKVLSACCEEIKTNTLPVKVITPPLSLEASLSTNLSALADCLKKVKEHSNLIILDLPKQLDQNLLALLDRCDRIILVTEPTISSVSGAKRWLSIFNDLEYDKSAVSLLINRTGKKQKQMEEEARKALEFSDGWSLPSSYQALEQACLEGSPLVVSHPKDPFARDVYKISNALLRDWKLKNSNSQGRS